MHVCTVECGTASMQNTVWSPSPHTHHSHTPTPHTLFTHTHMPTPLQEDKCRLLPQPKPVPTEGEEGEGEEPLLNKMADQWMSTRDLMKVCTCTHTQCWPQRMSALVKRVVGLSTFVWCCL